MQRIATLVHSAFLSAEVLSSPNSEEEIQEADDLIQLLAQISCNVCGVWSSDGDTQAVACGSALYPNISMLK